MPLPRMTTRRWMIAVAALALFLTVARLVSFSRRYRTLAVMHAREETNCLKQAQRWETRRDAAKRKNAMPNVPMDPAQTRLWELRSLGWEEAAIEFNSIALDARRRAAYESQLRLKYQQAARYPWLPVPPDPPEPE